MNSWPAPMVDWRQLTPQLGHGDLVCVVHGRVDAARGPWELPICPRCEQLLSQAQCDRRTGALIGFAEPHPAYCPGPQRHPYTPVRVRLGWRSCTCPRVLPGPGGHRWWTCAECRVTAEFPPHQDG